MKSLSIDTTEPAESPESIGLQLSPDVINTHARTQSAEAGRGTDPFVESSNNHFLALQKSGLLGDHRLSSVQKWKDSKMHSKKHHMAEMISMLVEAAAAAAASCDLVCVKGLPQNLDGEVTLKTKTIRMPLTPPLSCLLAGS